MKYVKKLMTLGLTAVCAGALLAGCGSSDQKPVDNNASNEGISAETESEEIKTTTADTLTVATEATFPPYEFYDGDEIKGIDVDIMKAVADKLGMELSVQDMDFNSIVTAVQSGKADVGAAGMTVTPERQKNVDFTDTYCTGVQVIIVTDGSDITGPDDLAGKTIGVQEATTGDIYASDDYGDENVMRYKKGTETIMALQTGKVDAVIIDNEPAKAYVAANEGLKILDTAYVEEDYGFAVAKDNAALTKAINAALTEMRQDGTLDEIIATYIKAE